MQAHGSIMDDFWEGAKTPVFPCCGDFGQMCPEVRGATAETKRNRRQVATAGRRGEMGFCRSGTLAWFYFKMKFPFPGSAFRNEAGQDCSCTSLRQEIA